MNARELTESAIRLDLDVNGNPRYYLPKFLFPVMSDKTRSAAGLNLYRGKKYGPGYVVQSYGLESDMQHALDVISRQTFQVGQRVKIHPASDWFMRGERWASIVTVGRKFLTVAGERSGRRWKTTPAMLDMGGE